HDGRKIAVATRVQASKRSKLFILDTADGREHLSIDIEGYSFVPVWSPDGTRVAVGGELQMEEPEVGSGRVVPAGKVDDAATGAERLVIEGRRGSSRDISPIFSPDGRRIALHMEQAARGGGLSAVKVWDAVTGKELLSVAVARSIGPSRAQLA